MSSDKFVQPAVPKFDGHYIHWAMLMENFLRSKEMWSLVDEGVTVAAGSLATDVQKKSVEDLTLKDMKVKNYLFQAIDREILETILDKSTSKGIWNSMKQKYEGSTRVKRAQLEALRKEYELLSMKEGEKIDSYLARNLVIVNKMKANGDTMTSNTVVSKVLRSLTPKFNYVVCSIMESNDLDLLTIDELHGSLLVHEQRMIGQEEEEQALKVSYDNQGGRGRGRSSSRGRGRGRGRSKDMIECYKCHKLGHYKSECPEWDKEANYANDEEENKEVLLMAYANEPELTEEDEMMPMAYAEESKCKREEAWFLDSGCSNHMCGDLSKFSNLDKSFKHTVKLGNGSRMDVNGRGNVKIILQGISHVLSGVYYIPELKNNILSIGQLQEKELAILIKGGSCKIYHPHRGLIIETKMSTNRMFMIFGESNMKSATSPSPESKCLHSSVQEQTQLWHRRYGLLNYKALKALQDKNMVLGLPHLGVDAEVCTKCLVGKHHRDRFPKRSTCRASEILELVHADICGPISPVSHSNKRYLLCFIDDYSRKSWIYFLTQKSEALYYFKCFKSLVEKDTGKQIKCLRTDRGGEFTSKRFQAFCEEQGIKRQLTASYSPQQNGVAERKNRTILNMVRAMLAEKEMPRQFWAEAVNWSNHVLNRCPTAALKDITPKEAWSGEKPSVDHFRVFRCLAHVHVPQQQRIKLDDRSTTCVLLGLSEHTKGYKLCDPNTMKIVISRDIVFEEGKQWQWNNTHQDEILLDLDWGDHDEVNDGAVEDEVVHEEGNEDTNQEVEPHIRRAPAWLRDYVSGQELDDSEGEEGQSMLAMMAASDPITFEEAVKCKNWRLAMMEEIKSIEKNNTWRLVSLPKNAKVVGVKWVFKTKYDENGVLDKHKARLVAKGYSQKYGIDYVEVFAPVARIETVRTIIPLAAQQEWLIYQLDVKSAFLHRELMEDVYVKQPRGSEVKGCEDKVYKLQKALYGLKQGPRAWFSRIESYFKNEGFVKCSNEQTLFTKRNDKGNILIVSIYVDDLIFT